MGQEIEEDRMPERDERDSWERRGMQEKIEDRKKDDKECPKEKMEPLGVEIKEKVENDRLYPFK